MSLAVTYYGASSIGASDQNPAADTAYTVPITLPSDSWVVAVEVGFRVGVGRLAAAVYADNGGVPGELIATGQLTGSAVTLSATSRWVAFPLYEWLPAGTYHVGAVNASGSSGAQVRYDAGSSGDGHTVDSNVNGSVPDGDYSGTTVTATSNAYSVRAVVIDDSGGPTPPTPGGGNRMDGRAIRKPPR